MKVLMLLWTRRLTRHIGGHIEIVTNKFSSLDDVALIVSTDKRLSGDRILTYRSERNMYRLVYS